MVRLSPENSPPEWSDIFEDIEKFQQQYILAQRFNEVTGLSIFDRDYIQSIPLDQWELILKKATMLAKSELEVKQTKEGLAKAAADLEKEDDSQAFWRLYKALADKLEKREKIEELEKLEE